MPVFERKMKNSISVKHITSSVKDSLLGVFSLLFLIWTLCYNAKGEKIKKKKNTVLEKISINGMLKRKIQPAVQQSVLNSQCILDSGIELTSELLTLLM